MARIRSRTLVLLVALLGVAALLAAPARAEVGVAAATGAGVAIVSPTDKSQLPAAGNGTVLVQLHDGLETELAARRVFERDDRSHGRSHGPPDQGQLSTTVPFGPSDLAPGITRVSVTASRDHGNTVGRGVSVFSWEPGIDATAADRCELLGQDRCLLPFPSDRFTAPDASTDTGRRVAFNLASMPANTVGVHIDPTEWNRSPASAPAP